MFRLLGAKGSEPPLMRRRTFLFDGFILPITLHERSTVGLPVSDTSERVKDSGDCVLCKSAYWLVLVVARAHTRNVRGEPIRGLPQYYSICLAPTTRSVQNLAVGRDGRLRRTDAWSAGTTRRIRQYRRHATSRTEMTRSLSRTATEISRSG